jgi:hypothetical protein
MELVSGLVDMVENGRWRRDRRELAPETVPPRPSDEWCLLVCSNCSAEIAATADSREGMEGSSDEV